MSKNGREGKEKNYTVSVVIIALVFLISLIDSLGLVFLFPLISIAVIAVFVYIVVKNSGLHRNTLTNNYAAKHLCRTHNGTPTRKAASDDREEHYHMSHADLREKKEELDALYNAGIIDAQERAERLSAAMD